MKVYREIVTDRIGPHIIGSELREATSEEVAAEKAKVASGYECDHTYVVDDPGWMYDFRSCAVCGQGLGVV